MLLGSYGQTNLGDDLLLRSYLKYFRELGHEELLVSATDVEHIPQSLRDEYPSARYFEPYRTSPVALVRLLLTVDVVVYGGGSVCKELYASTGREKYGVITRVALFNLLARALRRPIYNLNISIGHLSSRRGRLITKLALSCCRTTLMRDARSHEYATQVLGVNPSRVVASTDGLFLDDEWNVAVARGTASARRRCVIGVNVISDVPDWIDRAHYLNTVNAFLDRLLERGDSVVLVPFQVDFSPSNDYAFMLANIEPSILEHPNCHLRADVSVDNVTAVFAELDQFVGMRFHSLVLAATTGTPFVGISYDIKCATFLAESAYEDWIALEDVDEDRLLQALNRLGAGPSDGSRPLEAAVSPLFARARADLAAALPETVLR